jgi:hypothetical protein
MNIGSVLFNNSALFVCMSPNVPVVNDGLQGWQTVASEAWA